MRSALIVVALLALAVPAAAQEPSPQVIFVQEKNPAAAGLFSLLIPGGGQIYNGEVGEAVAFFGVGLVTIALATSESCTETYRGGDLIGIECEDNNAGLWAVAFLANTVFSITDAVKTSKRLNAEARARVQPTVGLDGRFGVSVTVAVP